MENSNSTQPPFRQQWGNTGDDDSTDAANHHLDNRRTFPSMIPEINHMMNQASAVNNTLQQHQAIMALGGQFPQQDYSTLMASAARSMLMLQGANAAAGQSPPGEAFIFPGGLSMSSPAGQTWLMAQPPQVSLAGVDPRLLAQFGGAGASQLHQIAAAPNPHPLMAASALLSQIGQANQQHPTISQLQQQAANLGAVLQSQNIQGLSSQHLAGANPQAAVLGAATQGDVNALLRALFIQQQHNAAAAQLGYPLSQPGVTSPMSLQQAPLFGGTGATGSVAHLPPASAAPNHQEPQLSGRPPVCLHLDLDEQTLSDYQCLLRMHIELFETRPEDIQSGVQGRNTPIRVGQVGIRCRHCANFSRAETNSSSSSAPPARRSKKGTIYYSRTLDGLYQVAQNLTKVHLCNSCPNIPGEVKARLSEMQKVNKRTSGGKEYWVYGLKELGVYEDKDMLRFRPPATAKSAGRLERETPEDSETS